MKITTATKQQAREIAKLIMLAMNHECCQNLAGGNHTLDDFENLMTCLVKAEQSQYSYTNTLVALDDDNKLVGICVSYHGAHLHQLRKAFIEGALKTFGIDYNGMQDEAEPDELYIDSIAVHTDYRRMGIAKLLLAATIEKAKQLEIDKVGLLVDKGNPNAETLYATQGFNYVNDTSWGGHAMKHLQYAVNR